MTTRSDNRRDIDEEVKEREERLKREKDKQQQLHNDRCELLQLPAFQRVMADVIAKGGMFRSVMTGNSATFHLSGRQDFAREIWTDMAKANSELAFDLLKPKFGEELDE